MAFIKTFPVEWLYYHYFIRKPVVWMILIGTVIWVLWVIIQTGQFPSGALLPLAIMGLAVILSYKMYQENAFQALDYPVIAVNFGIIWANILSFFMFTSSISNGLFWSVIVLPIYKIAQHAVCKYWLLKRPDLLPSLSLIDADF